MLHPIQSVQFSHIRHVSNDSDLAFAMIDCESVSDDPTYQHFHKMFTRFYDEKTCELLDADALHPFALASKMQSDDFPSFREILRMSDDERE